MTSRVRSHMQYRMTLGATALRYLVFALMTAALFTCLSGVTNATPAQWVRLVSYAAIGLATAVFRRRDGPASPPW